MKKSELKKLIKEELFSLLREQNSLKWYENATIVNKFKELCINLAKWHDPFRILNDPIHKSIGKKAADDIIRNIKNKATDAETIALNVLINTIEEECYVKIHGKRKLVGVGESIIVETTVNTNWVRNLKVKQKTIDFIKEYLLKRYKLSSADANKLASMTVQKCVMDDMDDMVIALSDFMTEITKFIKRYLSTDIWNLGPEPTVDKGGQLKLDVD